MLLSIGNRNTGHAPVAQLDRVFDYESKGRGFESLLAHQYALLFFERQGVFFYGINTGKQSKK